MQATIDGDKIRELRFSQFMTQTELATRAEIRVETLCRLEKGYRPARFATISKLATALGVEPQTIVTNK